MEFNRAFRYVFEDKNWFSKVALGLLIMIVPILNLAWTGYLVQIIRNVRKNEIEALPTWDDLGKKFMDGLMVVLAGLIYSLPIWLFLVLPMAIFLVPAAASGNEDIFATMMAGSMAFYSCMICLGSLYVILLSVLSPMVKIAYAREGNFAACFNVKGFFKILGRHGGSFFTIWMIVVGVTLGVSMAISILGTAVGWFPVLGQLILFVLGLAGPAYLALFSTHLYGQFARLVDEQVS